MYYEKFIKFGIFFARRNYENYYKKYSRHRVLNNSLIVS